MNKYSFVNVWTAIHSKRHLVYLSKSFVTAENKTQALFKIHKLFVKRVLKKTLITSNYHPNIEIPATVLLTATRAV